MERVMMQDCGDGVRRADNGSWGKRPVNKGAAGTYQLKVGETGSMFTTTGAAGPVIFVLPAVAKPGMWFTFFKTSAANLVVDAPVGVTVGSAQAGKQMENVTAGETNASITVVAVSATAWAITGSNGTWAANNT